MIKRILVPIDFSKHSLEALAYARDLAKTFAAELVLLHVIEPVYFLTASGVYDEQRRVSTAQLARIGAGLRKQEQPFRILVKGGIPSRLITETAKSAAADLVVMGTHGRTGLAHMLIGSVAEKVVRTASCAVLTVRRPPGKRSGPRRPARRRSR